MTEFLVGLIALMLMVSAMYVMERWNDELNVLILIFASLAGFWFLIRWFGALIIRDLGEQFK